MEQKELPVKLGEFSLTFYEQDRFGAILYKLYHEKIDPWIDEYMESLSFYSQAIGKTRLNSIKAVLNSKKSTREELANAAKSFITEYINYENRHEHEQAPPEDILDEIPKELMVMGDEVLARAVEHDAGHFEALDIETRNLRFKERYMDESGSNPDAYYINFAIYLLYSIRPSWMDLWNKEQERISLGKPETFGDIIMAVKRQISWMQEYPKKSRDYRLSLIMICEMSILDIISRNLRALGFEEASCYFSESAYFACQKRIAQLDADKAPDRKAAAIDALRQFPMDLSVYKYLLYEFGDEEGTVTSVADFFEINIKSVKEAIVTNYINALPELHADDESGILEQIRSIGQKKQYIRCENIFGKENELQTMWEDLDSRLRTVNGLLYDTREEAAAAKKEMLHQSQEPWVVIKDLISTGMILPELKDKFKYWDFDGLKKNYPSLLKYERPVLFWKLSLFGWGEYFVLTNKRALHMTKNGQIPFVICDATEIDYESKQLIFRNADEPDTLEIRLRYPEGSVRHLLNELSLLAHTLLELDETLFEIPEDFYQSKNDQPSTRKLFSNLGQGIHKDRKLQPSVNVQNQRKQVGAGKRQSGSSGYSFCPQCGTPIKSTFKFCSKCGKEL